tara:strand:- start:37 stop:321 length:285 start_codon:yes stop_codon:yes gene_type:complete
MINKWQVCREHAWTILSFPKRNKTILWNDTTKKYQIYKGVPYRQHEVEEIRDGKKVEVKAAVADNSYWRLACMCLAGTLGVTLALLFVVLAIAI